MKPAPGRKDCRQTDYSIGLRRSFGSPYLQRRVKPPAGKQSNRDHPEREPAGWHAIKSDPRHNVESNLKNRGVLTESEQQADYCQGTQPPRFAARTTPEPDQGQDERAHPEVAEPFGGG